jgi:hypothetical protein
MNTIATADDGVIIMHILMHICQDFVIWYFFHSNENEVWKSKLTTRPIKIRAMMMNANNFIFYWILHVNVIKRCGMFMKNRYQPDNSPQTLLSCFHSKISRLFVTFFYLLDSFIIVKLTQSLPAPWVLFDCILSPRRLCTIIWTDFRQRNFKNFSRFVSLNLFVDIFHSTKHWISLDNTKRNW